MTEKTNQILAKLEADGHLRVLPPLPTEQRRPVPLEQINPELAARREAEMAFKLARLAESYEPDHGRRSSVSQALPVRQSNGWSA